MTRFAESYAVWLADYYLLAAVLLALALTGLALLRQPAQRLIVTKSTFVALVLLAILCALPGWSVVHLLAAERPPTPAIPEVQEPVEHLDLGQRPYATQSNTVWQAEQPALAPPTPNDVLPQATTPKLSWSAWFAVAHLAGVGCIVVWLGLGWLASVRLRRAAQAAPANLGSILDELASLSRPESKRLRLFTHDRLDVAVAMGVWRPMILLPDRWTNTQSHDRLRAVLAHEATHILNHDLQWVALARILFVALWANPLFWLMKRRLRLDQEALADAAAAELSTRQRYAEQLVAWARDTRSRPALHLSSAVGLWEGPSQLRQRIAILLDERLTVLRNCSRRWRLAAAAIAIGAATVLSMVTLQPPTTAEANAPPPASADATALTDILGVPYERPSANDQKATASIPADAWGKPVNGLRAAIVIENRSIDKHNNLNYDVVVENVSDRDIRFSASIHGVYGFNSMEIIGADGKPLPRQPANIMTRYADPPRLVRFWLKPKERAVIPSLRAQLVQLDEDGHATDPQRNFPVEFFKVKPGQYSASVAADFGPGMETIDPVTKIRTVLSPKPNEWTGKVKTGSVRMALFQKPSSKERSRKLAERPEPNTITGRVVDERRQPIAGAEAFLFRINRIDSSRKLQSKKLTDAEGKYRFENVIDIPKEFPDGKLSPINPLEEEFVQVYVRAPGRVAGMAMEARQQIARTGNIFDMTLNLAYKLGGQVTGPDGKPVAGALVSVADSRFSQWDKVASARTKADGTYMINDAAPYSMEEYQKKKVELRTKKNPSTGNSFQYSIMVQPPLVTVEHPDFALKRTTYEKIPGTQDIKLEPAATIEGRVVIEDTSKPAAGAVVHLSNFQSNSKLAYMEQAMSQHAADTRTDADGKYRFTKLPADSYELSAEMPGWVNEGIDAFSATAGKTSTAPNLKLTRGGIISVRYIDDATGKPVPLKPGMQADISAHPFPLPKGISRPSWIPNASANSAGRFELHALPGKRAIMVSQLIEDDELKWIAKPSREPNLTVVDVVNGKIVEVDIPVVKMSKNPAAAINGTIQVRPVPATE